MELEKQMRLLGQAGIAIQVERFDGDRVYKLATGHRYAQLYDLNNGLNSGSDVGKGADRSHCAFGQGMQPYGCFDDDTQRTFGAYKQMRQVVPRSRLSGSRPCLDNIATGGDHCKVDDVLAHRAIAHRIRARRPGGTHSAYAGICAWVYREKQARVAQDRIQGLACYAGLHGCGLIIGTDRHHAVHLHKIQRKAALDRQRMPLEGRARAIGNERNIETDRTSTSLNSSHY